MDYQDALKKVQTKKVKDNFMVIETGYNKIILPYKDGLAYMAALNNAEQFQDAYSATKRITHFSQDSLNTRVLSSEEYEQIKIANLLNISIDDVKAFALET